MCTVVYTYLMCASWHIKAMLQYRFQMLERKPRPRSQSYIRPTSVVLIPRRFPPPPLSSPSLFPSFTHTVLPCIHVLLYMYMYMVMELYAKCMILFRSFTPLPDQHNSIVCGEWERSPWCRTDIVGSRCWCEHTKIWCKWWDVYIIICFNLNYHMCGYSQVLVRLDHNTVQWHWSRIKSVWSPGTLIGKLYASRSGAIMCQVCMQPDMGSFLQKGT